MKRNDFFYDIPERLIAQDPIPEREMSRLLVLDRASGKTAHKRFKDIVEYLKPGDCLVLNDTRVMPARLLGVKEDTGADIEFVLLHPAEGKDVWNVILKPGRRAKPGARFVFADGALKAEILSIEPDGNRLIKFEYEGIFNEILDKAGIIPLPPYIKHELKDPERYQTVYSRLPGSAAAPTAGLHFTKDLLARISGKGTKIAYITLHVGTGTFRPVKEDDITKHKMHSEYYVIPTESAEIINETIHSGGKVIAVGTTSCRVLETVAAASDDGVLCACSGWTDIFIYPGYKFKMIDALITNFHLPESTLIMLVSAFAGHEATMETYAEAVKEKYRFYSFGDVMFIK